MKKNIIRKWYHNLHFSYVYDELFDVMLHKHEQDCNALTTLEAYQSVGDTEMDLLAYLYFCEQTYCEYQRRKIPDEIFYATMHDLVVWNEISIETTGHMGLPVPKWSRRPLELNLFQLGRLQFVFGHAEQASEDLGLRLGEDVLEVHIPNGQPLEPQACLDSFMMAERFFQIYFPNKSFRFFTCHSWLLDPGILPYLKKESNIVSFQNLFTPLRRDIPSAALLKYIFQWDATPENYRSFPCKTGFAERIRNAYSDGVIFGETYGIRPFQGKVMSKENLM